MVPGEVTTMKKKLSILWQRLVTSNGDTCERCGQTYMEMVRAVEILKEQLSSSGIEPVLKTKELTEAEFKAKANSASRRTRLIRSHGHTYTYSRYQNTGQLSANLKQIKKGDKIIIDAGTRANYTSGYHGMYFLRNKKGMQDVKTTLKKGANYANSMKL